MKIDVPRNMGLRTVHDDDHKWLVELHNDPLVLHNVRDPRPITMEHHMAWWESVSHTATESRLIFVVDSQRVGFTKFYSIDRYNGHCLLGADIHKDFRGQGLAKYMWTLMLEICFEHIKLHRVALSTAAYNEIGQRVYRNLGFKEEGRMVDYQKRDGKYYDAICMYMTEDDWKQR